MAGSITAQPIPEPSEKITPEILGQYVRARRTQSGLRIDDAAALCGVSVETLSKVETAKSGVQLNNLFKVLNGLGVKLKVEPW